MQTRIRSSRSRKPASIIRFIAAGAIALVVLIPLSAAAEESGNGSTTAEEAGHGVGSTMHDIGTGARDAGREIGHGAANAGRTIGHTARDAAVVTWDAMKRTGVTIGHAARDGSKALVRGLKGEPERN